MKNPKVSHAILAGFVLLASAAGRASARAPFVLGVEHAPIVVADLERAQADYRALGFAIKPGRAHADGIRNAHVKFPDGTELELITAPAPTDALTSEYFEKQHTADGPIYFGLWSPDHSALTARIRALGAQPEQDGDILGFPAGDPLHHLFFGSGERSPTDRPEHFAHSNSALRMSGYWVRGNNQERALFKGLGIPLRRRPTCGPFGNTDAARLPRGDVFFVSDARQDGALIGARVEVKSLATAAATMKEHGVKPKIYPRCKALWVEPSEAHGIWLQFVEPS